MTRTRAYICKEYIKAVSKFTFVKNLGIIYEKLIGECILSITVDQNFFISCLLSSSICLVYNVLILFCFNILNELLKFLYLCMSLLVHILHVLVNN